MLHTGHFSKAQPCSAPGMQARTLKLQLRSQKCRRTYTACSRGQTTALATTKASAQQGSSSDRVPVAISGAGLAGMAAAVALHKSGVPVVVLERAPALRQEGSAVALWSNAWRALDALGVGQELRKDYLLLTKVDLVKDTGKLLRSFTFEECTTVAPAAGGKNETRGVMRARLLEALAAQLPEGVLCFNSAVVGVSTGSQGNPVVQLSNGQSVTCDVLIGADGGNSVVAKHLGLQPPKYAGYVAYRGLAKFPAGRLPVPPNTIRQIFGAGVRAGMYPMTEQGDVYWYICFNADENAPRPADPAGYVSEALSKVEGWAWHIREAVLATDPDTISRGSIRDRWTSSSYGQGCITLAGDAAHPMTPNLGQGGCTALEDSIVLARYLAPVLQRQRANSLSTGEVLDTAAVAEGLRKYEQERVKRCLPLTQRSNAFGAALQLPYAPVVAVRDFVVENLFQPAHFLDHTEYDCGVLPQEALQEANLY